jgi:hypothetical protein
MILWLPRQIKVEGVGVNVTVCVWQKNRARIWIWKLKEPTNRFQGIGGPVRQPIPTRFLGPRRLV